MVESNLLSDLQALKKMNEDVQTFKSSVLEALAPYTSSYFTKKMKGTVNLDDRRDYAALAQSRTFQFVDEETLLFTAVRMNNEIKYKVSIEELIAV